MGAHVQTRFVTKYRHVDGKLELKVTDDRVVSDREEPLHQQCWPPGAAFECGLQLQRLFVLCAGCIHSSSLLLVEAKRGSAAEASRVSVF